MSGAGERCGAWGGCSRPSGHNLGQADVPENHAAVNTEAGMASWVLDTPSLWESPDERSIPTLLAAIGQELRAARIARGSR